jgi:hypothetical protein
LYLDKPGTPRAHACGKKERMEYRKKRGRKDRKKEKIKKIK